MPWWYRPDAPVIPPRHDLALDALLTLRQHRATMNAKEGQSCLACKPVITAALAVEEFGTGLDLVRQASKKPTARWFVFIPATMKWKLALFLCLIGTATQFGQRRPMVGQRSFAQSKQRRMGGEHGLCSRTYLHRS